MARKLDDIFNECFERILQGESFESCLARYPEHAAELEPLLRTAFGITVKAASTLKPRPAFRHWSRVRLQRAQLHPRQQEQPQKYGFFSWQRAWAVALTAILVFLITGVGTVAASADAMPDQPLYPVKLATEQVKLSFAFSDTSKARINSQLAETRASEIETMVSQGKTEKAAATAERLANRLEQANYAIERIEILRAGAVPSTLATEQTIPPTTPPLTTTEETPAEPTPPIQGALSEDKGKTRDETPPVSSPTPQDTAGAKQTKEWLESLEGSASKSVAALQKALEQAPPEAKPALQRAIDRISERSHKTTQQGIQDKDKDKDSGKTGDEGKGNQETQPTSNKPAQGQPSSTGNKDTESGANPVPPNNKGPQSSTQNHSNNSKYKH